MQPRTGLTEYPELITERLKLNRPTTLDIPAIVKMADNPRVVVTTRGMPSPYYEEDAVYFLNRAYQSFASGAAYLFAIRLRDTDEFIGGIGLHLTPEDEKAELGYWLGEPHWGGGIATEAVGAMIPFAFKELGLHKVYAHHTTDNAASAKVLLKNGMIREGVTIADTKRNGKFRDCVNYRLTKYEYGTLSKEE
ncbi:GNAT family N-acetyltransferase [Neolewinella antarctica]|uniref:RimJ/RimL family protein N-acetyltransferase n=1 Tax=Neolewinella antarctica TaxID=442734 RepID=A0ABX0X5X4_9BACT|nr:GNAT family N-acetyltransferase [Neolewinella antarctica]NJC24616.1 RimJ/RimL family protein N-acetyltransferase [Neolewinella antarctica]